MSPDPNNFVRTSGDGWWSTERVPQPPPDASTSDDDWDIDSFFDSAVLLNPNFFIVCAAVALTQIIVGIWIIRGGLKQEARPSPSKTKDATPIATKPLKSFGDTKDKTA